MQGYFPYIPLDEQFHLESKLRNLSLYPYIIKSLLQLSVSFPVISLRLFILFYLLALTI